ncbi:MAG: hypothetical protein AB7O62_09360 [Pirellulales bacterium]
MPSPQPPSPPPVSRLTDSPWYWAYLFGIAALAGLVVMGPKFSQRQENLESRRVGREHAWKQGLANPATTAADGEKQPGQVAAARERQVQTWPLAALLVMVVGGAWFVLLRKRRGNAVPPPQSVPGTNGNTP